MRVFREGVVTVIATSMLIWAAVSASVDAATIYSIEMDRHYVSATKQNLAKQYEQVEERLETARRENDIVAAAEYEMMLDAIRLVDRRVNIVAIGNQVEQTKEAFLEEKWSRFVAERIIGAVGWGLGRIGFGKVTDTYMKGKNWPPKSNFITYDPLTNENIRIILGNRPELTTIIFSDEISDFGSFTIAVFDMMNKEKQSGSSELMSASQAQIFIAEQLEKFEKARPLPSEIGAYIASSMIRQAMKEGAHISDKNKLDKFARDWACRRLRNMATEQSTRTPAGRERFEALWAAVNILCGSADVESKQPEADTEKEKPADKTVAGNYDGYYEGELKISSQGAGSPELLSGSAALEVSGNKVYVTLAYSIYYEAILPGKCFATLSPLYKGEGALENPLSVELVLESYDLKVEGEGCGTYKERYEKDIQAGSTSVLKGTFIDEHNFKGSFLNLDIIFTKK